MTTKASNTLHKEIHPEQDRRVKAEQKIQEAKQGKLPDNQDLTTGIEKLKTGINKDRDNLSATGKKVTGDINNILDTASEIIKEKNDGELLQTAYYHSQQAGSNKSYSERLAELKQIAMGDKSATRDEARKNVNSMATIVKLAILSPEFRETIDDIAKISNQLLKRKSDKIEGEMDVEKTMVHETNIASKAVREDGTVEATVVESNPVEKPKKTKEQKREEREDKLIERLVDLAQTLHKKPEFRNSIEYMSNSAGKLKKYTKDKSDRMKEKKEADKSKENSKEVEHHKQEARVHAKAFLENWIAEDYSLDALLRQLSYLYDKSKTDEELRSLLKDWKKWSTSTVKDSDYVNDRERVRDDVKDLIHRTREMNSRYKEEVTIIRNEVKFINKQIQRDDSIQKLRDQFSALGKDILKDSNGNPVLKPELFQDAQIIIGSLIESIRYIPLPPIKRSDEKMDLELENIVLNVTDIAPSNVRFIVQADADKNASGSRQTDNSFVIEIKKIRADLNSVNFFVDKHTGFPKITDRGLADIYLGGSGLCMTIEIAPKMEKRGDEFVSVFEAKTVNCSIGILKIHLRETSHDTMYKLLSPIINVVAKKKIESGIANYVKENMNKMNTLTSQRATQTKTKADKKVQEKKQHD